MAAFRGFAIVPKAGKYPIGISVQKEPQFPTLLLAERVLNEVAQITPLRSALEDGSGDGGNHWNASARGSSAAD